MSLLTATTVVLTNQGEIVESSDYFSVSQGFYAQTSPPDVGNGNIVNFGIETSDTGLSYTISFTNSSGPKWFIGGSYAGAFASGSYSDGDLFAIYANPQEVVFTQNGTVIRKYPDADSKNSLPSLGTAYKMSLLYAFKNGGGSLSFPKSIFYPAGSRGTQGRTFTTLQVQTGSASIVTPTAFTLTANGDSVTTQESLAMIQGIYLQTRLPELQNIGDSVTFGFKGTSGIADFYLVYTKDTNVGVEVGTDYTISLIAYGGSPQPIGLGRTYPGNIWSLYVDYKVLIVSLDGSPFGDPTSYITDHDSQYQYSATLTTSSSTTLVSFKDVMFYPTGSPGKDGASTATFNAYPNNYRVLTPNSVRLVKSGNGNTFTNESFDGNTEGIYCQFVVPPIQAEGETITVQIQDTVANTPYYGVQFDMNGFTCVSSQTFITNGNYTTTPYGLIFSIYSDGTTLYFYNNGVKIASAPYSSGVYRMNIIAVGATVNETEPGILYFSQPYDITNIRFYPTGKLGPSGPSGVSGVSGPSGRSGPSGPSGVSGVSGPSGPSGPSGVSGVSGVSGPSGPSGPSGVSNVSGPSGPSGVSGVSGPSGPSGVSGVSGPVGPVATSISTSNVTGTSLTSGTSPAISTSTYGTYYYITNSGFNALTLPTTTAGSTVGSYWVLRNNTSTYLSITVTNTANVSTPLVIPPSNSATIVVTTASSSPAYVLF